MRPAAGILFAAALLCAGPAAARPPVWVVRDADSEMVLFGSVHVLPPGLDWRPAALDRALAKADDVWFELPVDPVSEAQAAALAAQRGLLPAGQTLSGLLSPAGAARLQQVLKRYGLPAAMIERMQPWLAEVAIAGAAYRAAGADAGSGVEKILSGAAPPAARQRALETPADQIAVFADTPMADQLASLEGSLAEAEDDPDAYARLIRNWMNADLAAIEKDAIAPMRKEAPGLFDRVVTQRNAAWTRQLAARLAGSGHTVVVVGVGHLIGPDNLPDRLRRQGFRVEEIDDAKDRVSGAAAH